MKTLNLMAGVLVGTASCITGCADWYGGEPAATPAVVATPTARAAPAPMPTVAPALAPADLHFADAAAGSGIFEVEVSRMAADRATIPAVRNFARMLVRDHTAANNELMDILHRRGVTPRTGIPPHLRAELEHLSGLSGATFDHEYIHMVGVQAHQHDIATFERAMPTLQDRGLHAWAERTLPVLRTHLRDAEHIAGTLAG